MTTKTATPSAGEKIVNEHFGVYFNTGIQDDKLAKAIDAAIRDSIADYELAFADHRRLVREIDIIMNGAGAALQASLCDLVGDIKHLGKVRDSERELVDMLRTCRKWIASRIPPFHKEDIALIDSVLERHKANRD